MDKTKLLLNLGLQVETLRTTKRLNQEQLSQLLGISKVSVNRLEKGKLDPQFTLLLKICDTFELKFFDFIKNLEDPKWKDYRKMSNGDKALKLMKNLATKKLLPMHWKKFKEYYIQEYGDSPKDLNQVLADLSNPNYCKINYPNIGKVVFKRVASGTYDLN